MHTRNEDCLSLGCHVESFRQCQGRRRDVEEDVRICWEDDGRVRWKEAPSGTKADVEALDGGAEA